MVASECGHKEVAQMLEAKGCSMICVNSSGKSAKKLADSFQRECEWAAVRPWDRGNILHLSAENLEDHLARRKVLACTHAHIVYARVCREMGGGASFIHGPLHVLVPTDPLAIMNEQGTITWLATGEFDRRVETDTTNENTKAIHYNCEERTTTHFKECTHCC